MMNLLSLFIKEKSDNTHLNQYQQISVTLKNAQSLISQASSIKTKIDHLQYPADIFAVKLLDLMKQAVDLATVDILSAHR